MPDTAALVDLLGRVRRTPPRQLPRRIAQVALRPARTRLRRWGIQRARGELNDRSLLAAFGGRFATTDAVLAHFHGPRAATFFVDPAEARRRAAAIAARYPHHAERTREAAEFALYHTVDLLGSRPTSLGPSIDWHTDWKVGYSWPRDFYEDIDYLALDHPCDVKMPWELSRCYQLTTLGRAYALDRDPRYAREFVAQLESWLDENPWPYGVNWGRAMEVALRAVNWLWASALFAEAPEFHDSVRLRMLKSLIQHGRHILGNLEYGGKYSGNHYLSNGVGLVFLGLMLPEAVEARRWLEKGLEIVFGEMQRQVHPDGVDFEKGIGYQGLVAEFWYSTILLCELNGVAVPMAVCERLERMFDFMLAYTRPDGTFPQVGDNDDGLLARLDDEPPGSHRRHLAVGGAMFGRPDLLHAAGDAVQTAIWLTGTDVLDAPRTEPRLASRAFPVGGFYALRADDVAMLVDAGEVGMNGIGGHGHNDLLSFDLWAAGAPLLVDSGTYVYTADPPARQAIRGTAAHNTVRVDGEETARLGGRTNLWLIHDDAHPRVLRWESDAEHDVLEAEHDGYTRLPQPVVHRRAVTLDKVHRRWMIQDALEGAGEHEIELFFHPDPRCPIVAVDGLSVCLRAPRADLWLLVADAPPGLTLDRQDGWVSRAYGHREPATVLRYHLRATVPLTITTVLALVPPGTPAPEARSMVGVPVDSRQSEVSSRISRKIRGAPSKSRPVQRPTPSARLKTND